MWDLPVTIGQNRAHHRTLEETQSHASERLSIGQSLLLSCVAVNAHSEALTRFVCEELNFPSGNVGYEAQARRAKTWPSRRFKVRRRRYAIFAFVACCGDFSPRDIVGSISPLAFQKRLAGERKALPNAARGVGVRSVPCSLHINPPATCLLRR